MKGKPKTFRLNEDQLTFVRSRNKLLSDQKALDFLLQAYWDVWHVKPNPFQVEDRKPEKQAVMIPQEPFEAPAKQLKTLAKYASEKRELETDEQYAKWLAELKADPNYSRKEKDLLIKYN